MTHSVLPATRMTLILTEAEREALSAAANALQVPISALVVHAALETAHRLGYYDTAAPAGARAPRWEDAPKRTDEETATDRVSVALPPLALATLHHAARDQLGVHYRVVHELCHFHHRDHTDAFWNEIDKVMQDYLERKEWLRKNGAGLDV